MIVRIEGLEFYVVSFEEDKIKGKREWKLSFCLRIKFSVVCF